MLAGIALAAVGVLATALGRRFRHHPHRHFGPRWSPYPLYYDAGPVIVSEERIIPVQTPACACAAPVAPLGPGCDDTCWCVDPVCRGRARAKGQRAFQGLDGTRHEQPSFRCGPGENIGCPWRGSPTPLPPLILDDRTPRPGNEALPTWALPGPEWSVDARDVPGAWSALTPWKYSDNRGEGGPS